jgi:hypothetical protein
MNMRTVLHNIARFAFLGGAVAILLVFLELIAQFLGMSLIGKMYSLGRILELAATLLIFVITVTLHEVRADLRASRS